VVAFKKLNALRGGCTSLVDTASDLGTAVVYARAGNTSWAFISLLLSILSGHLQAYTILQAAERRKRRRGAVEGDCGSTGEMIAAGMLNAGPLYYAWEASERSDAEITAGQGNEALNSIEHLGFLEASPTTHARHLTRNH